MRDRIIDLEPRALAALARVGSESASGSVFRRSDGSAWHADPTISGPQVNRAFQKIASRAGIRKKVVLHMIRHSWASWHYAVHKNLKKLKEDGAWESLEMADRYSHLAPDGMVPEIEAFWSRRA